MVGGRIGYTRRDELERITMVLENGKRDDKLIDGLGVFTFIHINALMILQHTTVPSIFSLLCKMVHFDRAHYQVYKEP
jgi:hypothetical protein